MIFLIDAPSTLGQRNLKTEVRFHAENASNAFCPHKAGATISGHFGFVFEENSVREIT